MPRRVFNDDAGFFPITINPPPHPDQRWFLQGLVLQGAGDGVIAVEDGGGNLMASVTTSASGGGVAAPGPWPVEVGTVGVAQAITIYIASGNPVNVSGWLDYAAR